MLYLNGTGVKKFLLPKTRIFYDELRACPSTSRKGMTSLVPHFSFPFKKYNSKAVIDLAKFLFASLFNGTINQNGL